MTFAIRLSAPRLAVLSLDGTPFNDAERTIVQEVEPLQLVLHCCTEKWEDVAWLSELGHLLSFTGIATYSNAAAIRHTIEHCPLSQLMIETDAPYLAPVPYRGKRNEPAFVA